MAVDVEFSRRDNVPTWLSYATPLFTVAAALVVGYFVLAATGADPIRAYQQILVEPLTSTNNIREVLVRTVPLVLAGLAVYLPYKAGLWNIGAEGQLYVGAMVGTAVALGINAPALLLLPVVFVVGSGVAAAWGFIPGYLRAKWDVNEIIVTLLMTFIAIQINQYLIQGPLRGSSGFPSSPALPQAGRLPAFGDVLAPLGFVDIHVGALFALLLVGATAVLMTRTTLGFKIRFVGANPAAAAQAGISNFRIIVLTMTLGGVLAGVAGVIELTGVQGRLQGSFSPGYGFTAIPIALLGQNGASRVLLASLFFALLFVGSNGAAALLNIRSSILDVIQALIILFLLTAEFVKRYRVSVRLVETGAPSEDVSEEVS